MKHFYKLFIIILFLFITACQLQESANNHGILFLENRSKKLVLNQTNSNDIIKILGRPHTKSKDNPNTWMYIERVLVKGKYHKLGKNVLKTNNILVLHLNKYGVLEHKHFLSKEDRNKLVFSTDKTDNDLQRDSFVQSFLQSLRTKMYGKK
tara:strand:- start:38 stop:490 length:453 start_codon:yes stop_codon:yes gene_type:complete